MENEKTNQRILKFISLIHKIYGWLTIVITVISMVAGSYLGFLATEAGAGTLGGTIIGSLVVLSIITIFFSIYNIQISQSVMKKTKSGVINSFVICAIMIVLIDSITSIVTATLLIILWSILFFKNESEYIDKKLIATVAIITILAIAYSLYSYMSVQSI